MSRRKSSNAKKFIVGAILIIIIAASAAGLYALNSYTKQNELEKIYRSFTCNCCDESLMLSDAYCAVGIKGKIADMQAEGISGQDLFDETVMLLGVLNIIDYDLRMATHARIRGDPPANRAIIDMRENHVNFGNVSETKHAFVMKDFEIKNIGTKDLYIYNIGTSCSCLTTKLVTEDWESPIYGRFSKPHGLTVKIAPGDDLRLRVTYDARVNSYFRGHELRYVYILTNDVMNPSTQLEIEVNHVD